MKKAGLKHILPVLNQKFIRASEGEIPANAAINRIKTACQQNHSPANARIAYTDIAMRAIHFLWSPYVIGQTIIFLPCDFYLSSIFFSSPNLSGHRLDVYHTLTHGVTL